MDPQQRLAFAIIPLVGSLGRANRDLERSVSALPREPTKRDRFQGPCPWRGFKGQRPLVGSGATPRPSFPAWRGALCIATVRDRIPARVETGGSVVQGQEPMKLQAD